MGSWLAPFYVLFIVVIFIVHQSQHYTSMIMKKKEDWTFLYHSYWYKKFKNCGFQLAQLVKSLMVV